MLALPSWEKSLFLWWQPVGHPWLDIPMSIFSGSVVWLPLIALGLWIAFKKLTRINFYLTLLFTAMLLAATDASTSYFFKNLFLRLRPCKMDELKELLIGLGKRCGGKYGFFSSHAANSWALVIFFGKTLKLGRVWWMTTSFFAALICWSRWYWGAHFPLDILIGSLWGCLLALFFAWSCLRSLKVPDA